MPKGTPTIRAFAVRPWGEALREAGAFSMVTFHVTEKDAKYAPDPKAPRDPVLAKVPKMFESKWGAGMVERIQAEVRLLRPGAPAPTLTLPLSPVEAGVYIGALTLPAAGRWLVELRLLQDGAVHYHSAREVVLP